ncbi:MAG: hypothetical protein LLF76_01490 [Planctomycetaceae bacterium]|nr:hypothetical protein [Planctomycetaceae bacterium]
MKKDIIAEYGQYITKEGCILTVDESPSGILLYTLQRPDGTVLIDSKSGPHVGLYQTWRLLWDYTSESLWVDSSDVGLYAWTKKDKDVYEFAFIKPRDRTEIEQIVPQLLWDSANLKLIK